MTIFESRFPDIDVPPVTITERVFQSLAARPASDVVLVDGPTGREVTAGDLVGGIKALAGQRRQPHGEPAQGRAVLHLQSSPLQALPTVDPHSTRAVDQNIGDPLLGRQRRQRPEAQHVAGQALAGMLDPVLAQDDRVGGRDPGHHGWCGQRAAGDLGLDRRLHAAPL